MVYHVALSRRRQRVQFSSRALLQRKRDTEYIARFRAKRRTDARVFLGGVCVRCGWDVLDELEFDHIDPKTKEYAISEGLQVSWKRLVTELNKCQLLCRPCHLEKTAEDLRKERSIKYAAEVQKAERVLGTDEAMGSIPIGGSLGVSHLTGIHSAAGTCPQNNGDWRNW